MSAEERLGKYRLLQHLATGGMGEVFLAVQEGPAQFSKRVVIKRIQRHLSNDASFVELLANEARLAGLLPHPNIVQVFELGEHDGNYFIAMEYVHGRSLSYLRRVFGQRDAELPVGLAAFIVAQALKGLHFAHQLRDENGRNLHVVHRDVSPDNILLGYDGVVKVTDFGIAKATAVTQAKTGVVRGKLGYMSPEHLMGGDIDGRSDVFSAGLVLLELVTHTEAMQTLVARNAPLNGVCLTSRELQAVAALPPVVGDAIVRAVRYQPDERFASAAELASSLEAFARDERVGPDELAATLQRECPPQPTGSPSAFAPVRTQPKPGAKARPAQEQTPVGARRRRPLWPAIAAAATALAVLGVWWVQPPAPTTADKTSTPQPPPAVAVAPSPAPTPVPAAAPVGAEPEQPAPIRLPTVAVQTRQVLKPASPRAATGTVVFLVNPWGEVFLNNKLLGVTPMDPVKVPAGPQVFVVRNQKLNVERQVKVRVPADGETEVRLDLERPWAPSATSLRRSP